MKQFKNVVLFFTILLTVACTKDDDSLIIKEDSKSFSEQKVSFSYEGDLQKYQGIITRYKFTENKKLIPSKEFNIPGFAKQFSTKENQEKLRVLIEKTLASSALPYVKYAYIHVGASDGNVAGGFIGYMKDDLKEMYISISLSLLVEDINSGKGTKETIHTIVHEYGHTIAENRSQIIPSADGSCSGTVSNADTNGCAKEKSYINTSYNKFWKPILKEYNANPGEFVEKHPNDFVTGYAATNYGEDIAETFTFFVLEDKPLGNLIKDQKIKLLYNYPELVALRTEIRKGLK